MSNASNHPDECRCTLCDEHKSRRERDTWEEAYLSLNRDYQALEADRDLWRKMCWAAEKAKRERCNEWYDSEKARLRTLEILEAAAKQFPNDDGWLHEAQGLISDSQAHAKCPICGSAYAKLARCACGKNPL